MTSLLATTQTLPFPSSFFLKKTPFLLKIMASTYTVITIVLLWSRFSPLSHERKAKDCNTYPHVSVMLLKMTHLTPQALRSLASLPHPKVPQCVLLYTSIWRLIAIFFTTPSGILCLSHCFPLCSSDQEYYYSFWKLTLTVGMWPNERLLISHVLWIPKVVRYRGSLLSWSTVKR